MIPLHFIYIVAQSYIYFRAKISQVKEVFKIRYNKKMELIAYVYVNRGKIKEECSVLN
jgi:translation initiation factor IF-2